MGADNPMLALVVVYLCTVVLTEVITNNAAAVLALPLGLAMAARLGVSPMPFVFAVMIAASASFMTPIGYQTNLMVMGAGGYKPSDYPRLGLPLSLTVGVLALVLIPIFWPFAGTGG
jgi:di/tricarboxylate transporter